MVWHALLKYVWHVVPCFIPAILVTIATTTAAMPFVDVTLGCCVVVEKRTTTQRESNSLHGYGKPLMFIYIFMHIVIQGMHKPASGNVVPMSFWNEIINRTNL